MNKFPILNTNEFIPLDLIKPHENQALKNHCGQTLKRLAERGCLDWIETLCVLEDREFKRDISIECARNRVLEIVNKK